MRFSSYFPPMFHQCSVHVPSVFHPFSTYFPSAFQQISISLPSTSPSILQQLSMTVPQIGVCHHFSIHSIYAFFQNFPSIVHTLSIHPFSLRFPQHFHQCSFISLLGPFSSNFLSFSHPISVQLPPMLHPVSTHVPSILHPSSAFHFTPSMHFPELPIRFPCTVQSIFHQCSATFPFIRRGQHPQHLLHHPHQCLPRMRMKQVMRGMLSTMTTCSLTPRGNRQNSPDLRAYDNAGSASKLSTFQLRH